MVFSPYNKCRQGRPELNKFMTQAPAICILSSVVKLACCHSLRGGLGWNDHLTKISTGACASIRCSLHHRNVEIRPRMVHIHGRIVQSILGGVFGSGKDNDSDTSLQWPPLASGASVDII